MRRRRRALDEALYAYAGEDAEFPEGEPSARLPPGWFGENLRVEVTMPRAPRQAFARSRGSGGAISGIRGGEDADCATDFCGCREA
ncbi:hypothetical protein Mlaev_01457 [Microbacterium laevaniformans]|uniref:Uncharacterized protein n=1 Tax=Microbacterium laevaniformans TaxID=36807 RepID=A0A150HFI0_9MICO|nr:hypothetical protein [Microbacterium laevaniformans]KXZ60380.1 hypothetical protein Mlaev_01457 [Microbacterium laevaniformans]